MSGKKKMTTGRIVRRILLIILLLVLLGGGIVALVVYEKYGKQILECRDKAVIIASKVTKDDFRGNETSICYYSDGSVMSVLKAEKDVYYLDYENIPKNCVSAMLATEDRKFFTHNGYDIYAILRAAKAYIVNEGEIHQGGSTITQQLARTVFLTNEQTVERKATEIFLAAELEKRFSKEQILEFYLNNIYFANGYYGLQAAAEGYFDRSVGDLSLSEQAYLCGIPNSPSSYNPIRYPDKTLERRDSVLKQMFENGYISEAEYHDALAQEIVLKQGTTEKYDYAETYTYFCAVRAIMTTEGFNLRTDFLNDTDREAYEEIYNDEFARIKRSLFTKGYRIYTSLNRTKQEQLQEAINDELAGYTEVNEEGIYTLQSAAACIDNDTGFVVAVIGGRGQDYEGYTLNRAYQSRRQPGSSIKPLIVYTPMFERGYYPDTPVVDERFAGGPRNSGGVYSGEIDVRYAVSVSKNTVAWKLFEELTPKTGLSYLKRMNFDRIVDSDYVPAAALGGFTYGASAVEMAGAYATLANQGVFRTPTCIVRICNADGEIIIDNSGERILTVENTAFSDAPLYIGNQSRIERRIYDKNAALMMTDVLQTVMTTGTGRKMALDGITSAGKTGTTNDQKDGWFAGYTGYYTTVVWVGYDYPKKLDELMGNTYPGYIWKNFMSRIHEGFEDRSFETFVDDRIPETVEEDTDGDGIPDYLEEDTDGDGISDYPEEDTDGDGIPDYLEEDTDGVEARLPDGFEGHRVAEDGNGGFVYISDRLADIYGNDVTVDWEGKPVYFDDDGDRILYSNGKKAVKVGPDGYPSDIYTEGEWILYDEMGNPVIVKVK